MTQRRRDLDDDSGAVLVLALLFILTVGLIGGALAEFTSSSLAGTTSLQADRAQTYAAESAIEVAVQTVRSLKTTGNVPGYNGVACPTTTVPVPENGTTQTMQVVCVVGQAPLPYERSITFAACPTTSSCLSGASTYSPAPGSAALVVTTALFHDLANGCSVATPSSCFAPGTAVDLTAYDVQKAG